MKDVKEFHHMLNDLCSISDCPNFSDRMRDNAMNLLYYIKDYKPEPPEPLIVEPDLKTIADNFQLLLDQKDRKIVALMNTFRAIDKELREYRG